MFFSFVIEKPFDNFVMMTYLAITACLESLLGVCGDERSMKDD